VADRMRIDPRRLSGPKRLAGVDLARGLAVLGMIAAHLLPLQPFDWAAPATWGAVVEGRSSILFAVLAGVSIAIVSGGTRPVTGSARSRARRWLAIRAGMLWLLGMLLVATGVPVYVILPAYAVLFLLAMPLVGLGAGALLVLGGAGLLVMPWVQAALESLPSWDTRAGEAIAVAVGWAYPFPLWICFLLVGMGIGRLELRAASVQWTLLGAGVGTAMIGYGLGGLVAPTGEPVPTTYLELALSVQPHSGGLPEALGSAGFAVAVVALSLLVCRTPVRSILWPLRATGSMPLTAYTAQIVVWAVWALLALGGTADLYGFRMLDPFWPITLGVVAGCTLWALWIGRGPLETLLDTVTRVMLRRAAGAVTAPAGDPVRDGTRRAGR